MIKDKITEYIGKSLNILFISNPIRTSMGVLLGFCIDTLKVLFTPFLKTVKYIDVQTISCFKLMIFGAFLVNFPLIFKSEKFSPEVEKALKFIKIAKKNGSMSEIEGRQMFRNLFDTLLKEIKVEHTSSQIPTQKATPKGISEII